MRFTIFDVGHGFCAQAIAENGNSILFDCGHKTDPEVRPSDFLPAGGCTELAWLYVTNYDEDHIGDLPRLRSRVIIKWLSLNSTISPDELRALKLQSGPLTPAMGSMLDMLGTYIHDSPPPPPTPGLVCTKFWNSYPHFEDTNNLSLVTFLSMGDLQIIIPGDLERQGWLALLERRDFQEELRKTNIFIASHHGRESGYCAEVFNYCSPSVIVFSDSEIKHATQEMANVYDSHARGITFNGQPRKVLSTRRDGTFWWEV